MAAGQRSAADVPEVDYQLIPRTPLLPVVEEALYVHDFKADLLALDILRCIVSRLGYSIRDDENADAIQRLEDALDFGNAILANIKLILGGD